MARLRRRRAEARRRIARGCVGPGDSWGCARSRARWPRSCLPPRRPTREQFTLKSKPFLLSGFKTIFPKVGVPTPKRSGYITCMDAHLIDEHGRRVSIRNVMLHHIVFVNTGYKGGTPKKTTCKGRGGEPFWGTGEEKQPLILPARLRLPGRPRATRWTMQAMLMSHDLQAHTVRVVFTVRMVTGVALKRVKPLWLRANGCTTHPSYDVEGDMPLGGVHNRSYLWRMPLSGRIVAASAHLHGSSYGMTIDQPRCGGRTLIEQKPMLRLSRATSSTARDPCCTSPARSRPATTSRRPGSRSARASSSR